MSVQTILGALIKALTLWVEIICSRYRGIRGISMRVSSALCVAGMFFLAGCNSSRPDYDFVQTQWTESIKRFGADLQPVYPPTEDIQIGDVYAFEAGEGESSITRRAFKVGYALEIYDAVRRQYAQRLMLPVTEGAPAKPAFSGRFLNSLPVAAFPEYAISEGHYVDFSASLPGKIIGFLFGVGVAESTDLKVAVEDNSTFGLPAYDALEVLARFCGRRDNPCDQSRLKSAFRATYGRWPTTELYIRLISRVYVTSTIRYTYVFRSASAVRAVQARLDSMNVFAEKASALVTPPAVPADNPETASNEAVDSARDVLLKQLIDSMRADLVALAGNKDGSAFSFSASSYSGNSIAMSQTFVRPLTFADGGFWWDVSLLYGPPSRTNSPTPIIAPLPPKGPPANPANPGPMGVPSVPAKRE